MNGARLEQVHANRVGARVFLAQSEAFLEDANRSGLGSESRSVLLHNAAIAACDGDTEELLERLDAAPSDETKPHMQRGSFLSQH